MNKEDLLAVFAKTFHNKSAADVKAVLSAFGFEYLKSAAQEEIWKNKDKNLTVRFNARAQTVGPQVWSVVKNACQQVLSAEQKMDERLEESNQQTKTAYLKDNPEIRVKFTYEKVEGDEELTAENAQIAKDTAWLEADKLVKGYRELLAQAQTGSDFKVYRDTEAKTITFICEELIVDKPINYEEAGLQGVYDELQHQLEIAEAEQIFRLELKDRLLEAGAIFEEGKNGEYKIILVDGTIHTGSVNNPSLIFSLETKHFIEDAIKAEAVKDAKESQAKEIVSNRETEPVVVNKEARIYDESISVEATEVFSGKQGGETRQRSINVHNGDKVETGTRPATIVGGIGEGRIKHKATLFDIMFYLVSLNGANTPAKESYDRNELINLFASQLGIKQEPCHKYFNPEVVTQPSLANKKEADLLYKKLGDYVKNACKNNAELVYAALSAELVETCRSKVLESKVGKSTEGKCSKKEIVNEYADILAEAAQDSLSELLKCTVFTARSSQVWERK